MAFGLEFVSFGGHRPRIASTSSSGFNPDPDESNPDPDE